MKFSALAGSYDFLQVVEGNGDPEELKSWTQKNLEQIKTSLLRHGGILFRNFGLSPNDFRSVAQLISTQEVPYLNGATPRAKYSDGIYLASDFPKELTLPQHHEMSYMHTWPMKAFFYCDIPAAKGGETPVCSTRRFMEKISNTIVEKFSRLGVRYLRNYDGGLVTDWRQAFRTESREVVERVCRDEQLTFEWHDGDRLRTWGVAQGTAVHPETKELLWHNHIVNFTFRTDNPNVMPPVLRMLAPAVSREQLEVWKTIDHQCLPMNAYYGDGSFIEQSVLDEVSGVLENEKVAFAWQKGDMILLDNMLAFHGRNPFEGERRILSIMKEPSSGFVSQVKRAA